MLIIKRNRLKKKKTLYFNFCSQHKKNISGKVANSRDTEGCLSNLLFQKRRHFRVTEGRKQRTQSFSTLNGF